jgi:hypothetical protein
VVLYNVKPLVIFLTLGGALGQSKKFPPVGNSDFSLWITFLHQAFIEHLGGAFKLYSMQWLMAFGLEGPLLWEHPSPWALPYTKCIAQTKAKCHLSFYWHLCSDSL